MKAMILSAGYGTRLGDAVRDTPKPMLRLRGRPILEYIICHLAQHGFHEIAVNLHFMPNVIRDYFGDGSRFGVDLIYSEELELLGTAGGVKRMANYLNPKTPFLVHYGDIITDQDFGTMYDYHQKKGALATLLLHQRKRSNSIVTLNREGCITEFLERPSETVRRGRRSTWVNSGVCVCSPQFLEEIPADEASDLPRDIFFKLVESRQLFGFPLSGYRCAVDSPERLVEARAAIEDGRCQIQLCSTLSDKR